MYLAMLGALGTNVAVHTMPEIFSVWYCKLPAVRIDWTTNEQALLGQTSIQTPWHQT